MTEAAETSSEPQRPPERWTYGEPGQPTSLHPYTGAVLPFPIHRRWTMILLILLGSIVAPLLVALNWRRIGHGKHAVVTLLIGYVGAFLVGVVLGLTIPDAGLLVALGFVSGWIISAGLILWQRKPYLAWRATLPAEPSFWRAGCFIYTPLIVALFYVVTWLTIGGLQRAAPLITTRFDDGRMSFDYPALWRVDTSMLACGVQPERLCVGVVRGIGAEVLVYRVQSPSYTVGPMDDIAHHVFSQLRLELPVWVELDAVSSDPIDGYEARVQNGTATDTAGGVRIGDQFRVAVVRTESDQSLLVVGQSTRESAAAVESLIRSIEVKPPAEATATP